jgi:preprotein translocase subunit SecA
MINSALKKVFGTRNDRELKRMRKVVRVINALEEDMQALDDEALAAKTDEFRKRVTRRRDRLTACFRRPSRWYVRPVAVLWVCGISTCS